MFKRAIILGLILLLVGTAALGWILIDKRKEQQEINSYKLKYGSEPDEYLKQYNEWLQLTPEERDKLPLSLGEAWRNKTKAQLQQEQQERLKADLDELAAGETGIHPFVDILYGENWREELSKYKKQKEQKEFVLTGSIVCISTGGTVCGLCLLLCTVRLFIRGLSRLGTFFAAVFRSQKQADDKEPAEAGAKTEQENSEQEIDSTGQQKNFGEFSKALVNSGLQELDTNLAEPEKPTASQVVLSVKQSHSGNGDGKQEKEHLEACSAGDNGSVAILLSDEKSVEFEESSTTTRENLSPNTMRHNYLRGGADTEKSIWGRRQKVQRSALSGSDENSLKFEDSIKAQTENLEKQMEECRQMAQSVQQTTLEHSKPISSTLKELTQQVSAIREYAANQQDRVEKLQDGYDWNIIRTFCLRVIRCIDNLGSRIARLSEKNLETAGLSEVKDELIFALESSGIAQFELEIGSDYRGQEKFAEAVKEKQSSDDPNQTGKIAENIRPGYQYFINDENVKVVRTAQVKLFG